jgi:hypothetical protein
MKLLYATICLIALSLTAQAKKKKVLFIGNSYTYVNNLPQVLADMALSMGDTVIYDSSAPGGYTFQNHSTNATTLAKIKSQNWDVVVLQAQSQEPSFPPAQVMSGTYPYGERLVDSVRKYLPCANILFYMTWGRQNGDAANCAGYPPLCTYAGMQARLRESYMMFKENFMTGVAPVGVAWKKIRASNPTINLYDPDESHPSIAGTYLAASVFYSSVFLRASNTSTYTAGINATDAAAMRTTASTTVMDSVALWNLNSTTVVPQFTYTSLGNNAFAFQNTSKNATQYVWNFGSTQASPTHTFTGTPPFIVKLVARNGCKKDSVQMSIGLLSSIADLQNDGIISLYPNPVSDLLSIHSASELKQLIVTNQLGEIVERKTWTTVVLHDELLLHNLKAGIYFISVETKAGTVYEKVLKL